MAGVVTGARAMALMSSAAAAVYYSARLDYEWHRWSSRFGCDQLVDLATAAAELLVTPGRLNNSCESYGPLFDALILEKKSKLENF